MAIIDVNEHNQIRLKDVFEPIELVSTDGESLLVCLRDGGFEVGIENPNAKSPDNTRIFSWYKIHKGDIERLQMQDK